MGYHYNLAQLISLQVIDGDSVLLQLSCDLNPQPVTLGQGFDYSVIRSRAEQNLELAKSSSKIQL